MADAKTVDKAKTDAKAAPKVLAVFVADCRATKGYGSTVAVVKGSSGKCRLYGRKSLANAFPEQEAIVSTLLSAEAMAGHFHCSLCRGKDACDSFVAKQGVNWAGSEAVLADKGQSGRKRSGSTQTSYRDF